MGKLVPRLASRKKAKRWAKGQSSSSNPVSRKYREQATGMFFKELRGSAPGITREDLRKHDAIQGIEPPSVELDVEDEKSIVCGTAKTRDTFASNYSDCSNISFSKFLGHFQSTSIVHKEMLAVLAAVTEVIKQNGGNESSTEYFAALMSTLEAIEQEDETSMAATLSLLGMCLKTVPKNVLNLQFGATSQTLIRILSRYAVENENHLVPRHCIGCLSVLLRAQEATVWLDSWTTRVLDVILSFVTHAKPKIRKSAQHGICAILKASQVTRNDQADSSSSPCHPAAGQIATHCLAQLDAACEPGSSLGATTILHILMLLKDIISHLPKSHVRTICERLLSIMTLNNVLITSCCLQTLHGLFVTKPKEATLPFLTNANIIKALYDYQPSANDTQPTLAWLAVMREAHCNLVRLALSKLSCHDSHDVFSTLDYVTLVMLDKCIELLLSDKTEIVAGASHTIKTILQECVAPFCKKDRIDEYLYTFICIVKMMHKTLSYRYLATWRYIFHFIAILFQIADDVPRNDHFNNLLKTLGDLREVHDFAYSHEIEYAIGAGIRQLGPLALLNIFPLKNSENAIDLRHSWMIPLFKESITHGSIVLFMDVLLPIAQRCEVMAKASPVDRKAYELLNMQIWSILPSICNNALDVKDNFRSIAKLLGMIISDPIKKDLRLTVLAALRKLVIKATNDNAVGDVAELARYAKNYLPILFNLYTSKPNGTDEEGIRLAAFDTINVYLTITSSDLANELFDRALSKFNDSAADAFFKESVYDLMRALIGYTDIDRLSKHYEMWLPIFKDETKRKEQKKAYRFLEEICGSKREVCQKFLQERRCQIEKMLVSSASNVIRTSRGARLRCITHLVKIHPHLEGTKFLEAIVPEAVLCVKDINERCRDAAYQLLNAIAEIHVKKFPEHFKDYLNMLIVGLASDERTYVSASLLVLASIVYHYKVFIGTEISTILEHTCAILTSPTREIVESALSLLKVYIPSTAVTLPRIVRALSQMSDDCKRHFRQKVRDIFTKLIRKYGFGTISSMVPDSDLILHKRLKNINKVEETKRKKRELVRAEKLERDNKEFDVKKKLKSIEEILADSDEEFDATEDEPVKRNKKKTMKKDTWIQESEDNIVDLANPAAARNITTTQPIVSNPRMPEKKIKDRGFATAPDGRLIITDDNERDSDVEKKSNKKRKSSFLHSDSEDDYKDEDDVSVATANTTNRKRKYSESMLDARSLKSQSTSRYQAGGSGIHRSLKATRVNYEPGSEYRATKAKGDIKKKGKPDPYAYVPLTRSILNKRKKKKNAGKFQSIVTGAKKGARAGLRNKRRKG